VVVGPYRWSWRSVPIPDQTADPRLTVLPYTWRSTDLNLAMLYLSSYWQTIVYIITDLLQCRLLTLWHGRTENGSSKARDHAHTVPMTSWPLRLNIAFNFIGRQRETKNCRRHNRLNGQTFWGGMRPPSWLIFNLQQWRQGHLKVTSMSFSVMLPEIDNIDI